MKIDIKDFFASCPKGVAHRGFHDLDAPENSEAAFKSAIKHHLPFECDVHLSKDGELIVCHDSSLLRVTGKEGIIEELSLEEIKHYHLEDGSSLLTLDELYSFWKEKVPLVLELKVATDNEKPLASRVRSFLKKVKDLSKLVLISFSEEVLEELTDVPFNRGLLIGEKKDLSYKKRHSYDLSKYDFIDLNVLFLHFPMFSTYRKNGGFILTWTVRSKGDYLLSKSRADCPTWEVVDCRDKKEDRKINSFLIEKAIN
ncbi:MAG: hypothetical protein J6328_07655 [Bacilli bacterium]|nr:hypothetical protein [Bacilli bacterium]